MHTRKNFELKNIGFEEEGIITGYASVFNEIDLANDVIKSGAFTASLNERTPVMLWNHNSDIVLGKWLEIREDKKGLFVKGQLCLDVEKSQEIYGLLKNESVTGLSIGFSIDKSAYDVNGNRIIEKLSLFEISIVPIPCNEKAQITDVKSLSNIRDVERFLKSRGLSNSEAKSVISKIKSEAHNEVLMLRLKSALDKWDYIKNQ